MAVRTVLLCWWIGVVSFGCETDSRTPQAAAATPTPPPLFDLLDASRTGISFANTLTEGPNTNVLVYEYFYNGGGVATADFDGDGRPDLYFTANLHANALYLNRGDFRFEEVAAAAGASGRDGPWQTGVAVVDINTDGLPDLYLSYSGMLPPEKRRNQLLVNRGVDARGIPQFVDEAADYGLDSPGFTNQAYFVDYDGDQDLDVFLLNHNPKSLPVLNEVRTRELLSTPDSLRGLRLYRNDDGFYRDVTEESGINGSALSYGLSLALGDYNGDGLVDAYVANDYEVPNYLYLNDGDGTFTDALEQRMGYSSHFSMGSDAADIDNDGADDLFVLDMLPADHARRQLLTPDDNRPRHALNATTGYPPQRMRNMLHLNRGDHTYAEIGRLAGVAATDWSWSALFADFDNDGLLDLHVTNGYLRDYTNLDFIKYMQDFVQTRGRLQRDDVLELLRAMPSSGVSDYLYHQVDGPLPRFEDVTAAWGLQRASNSNGAVTVDLDQDGHLDLVVNTVNAPALIYRNSGTDNGSSLVVDLQGPPANPQAIGAVVTLRLTNDSTQRRTNFPQRGYLSSSPTSLHFGLGKGAGPQVKSISVDWPDGTSSTHSLDPSSGRVAIVYGEGDTTAGRRLLDSTTRFFVPVPVPIAGLTHSAAGVDDLDRQPLLPRQLSAVGPTYLLMDMDGDRRPDLVVGEDGSQPTRYYPGRSAGRYSDARELHRGGAPVAGLQAFDSQGSRGLNLIIGVGGYHQYTAQDDALRDIALQASGRDWTATLLPGQPTNTTVLAATRVDEVDYLFCGAGSVPGRYPQAAPSKLLYREADGTFQECPSPLLQNLGAISDAAWGDLTGDGRPELVVVGHWMPPRIFRLTDRTLTEVSAELIPQGYSGWYNAVALVDLNGDDNLDIVAGNEGLNGHFTASAGQPVSVLEEDVDGNGAVDPLVFAYLNDTAYLDATRDELLGQLTGLRRQFPSYASYAAADAMQVLAKIGQDTAAGLKAEHLASTVFLSGQGRMRQPTVLPLAAQLAPVHTITVLDANQDGLPDVLLCGNEHNSRLRSGPDGANAGTLLLGRGDGAFDPVPQGVTGLQLTGDVRTVIDLGDNTYLFGRYGQAPLAYKLRVDAP